MIYLPFGKGLVASGWGFILLLISIAIASVGRLTSKKRSQGNTEKWEYEGSKNKDKKSKNYGILD